MEFGESTERGDFRVGNHTIVYAKVAGFVIDVGTWRRHTLMAARDTFRRVQEGTLEGMLIVARVVATSGNRNRGVLIVQIGHSPEGVGENINGVYFLLFPEYFGGRRVEVEY